MSISKDFPGNTLTGEDLHTLHNGKNRWNLLIGSMNFVKFIGGPVKPLQACLCTFLNFLGSFLRISHLKKWHIFFDGKDFLFYCA